MKAPFAPFAPGELVVCFKRETNRPGPVVGSIYTVREMVYNARPEWGVRFYDLPDPIGCTGWYCSTIFRPLGPDDLEKIKEKYSEPVKKARERTE